VGLLIEWAYQNGYELTAGEFYRTPEQAALNARKGVGIATSLHTQRLAVDFQLFRNNLYLPDSAAHAPLGAFWKSLGADCSWGGDFSKPDGGHYSISHNGVR
jgi:hypothetical protein